MRDTIERYWRELADVTRSMPFGAVPHPRGSRGPRVRGMSKNDDTIRGAAGATSMCLIYCTMPPDASGRYCHVDNTYHGAVAGRGWLARLTTELVTGNPAGSGGGASMIAGHFGLAAGVKTWAPRLPLWALMLSTFLLDVIFIFLNPAGIEYLTPVDPAHPNAYGGAIIHAYYTHSLVGALLIAAIAGLLASRAWGQRGGMVIAGVVFSHWILDLLVHRPDLPILPGNAGNLPLLGFGLWQVPIVSALVELALVLGGAYLYYRSAIRLPIPPGVSGSSQRHRVLTASIVTGVLLLLLLITNFFGL